jgi:zinc transport system substrate-binding protein
MKIAQKVRDELSTISPENKELFQANYTKFEQELKMLDDNFAIQIKGKTANNFIIFHDAYGYLFADLGIDKSRALLFQKNITGSQNPAELQEFIDAIKEKNISIFFREPQFKKSQLDNLAKQYNLTGMILDPLGANQETG